MRLTFFLVLGLCSFTGLAGERLPCLPERADDAPTGSQFVQQIQSLDLADREKQIYLEIVDGNVPDFLREFQPVAVTNASNGRTNTAVFYVAADYLAVGTDDDYFLTPMTAMTAQRIADQLGCILPARKMVNEIYAAAEVKLAPQPIPPGPAMTTVQVFAKHNEMVRASRAEFLNQHPLGVLVAGHQKDLVLTPLLEGTTDKVAIYGWQRTNGAPIQPLYVKHSANWVDYSQCVRLVRRRMLVNGQLTTVAAVLADPVLAGLLSDEGVIAKSRYPTNQLQMPPPRSRNTNSFETGGVESKSIGQFGELVRQFVFSPEVNILINEPARTNFAADKPILLICYALPNGNTIEQTIGHRCRPGDDWHFDIQHIGAQTRFLRELITNRTVVVAYLQAAGKSWPAWRKLHGDERIPDILRCVQSLFPTNQVETVLASHSGGGSFIFGYFNTVESIPNDVVRIAFLDSNYGYDPGFNHDTKLCQWLMTSTNHSLCVLAYDDASARLEGQAFVSAEGGTWGRSHAMLADFSMQFRFTSRTNAGMETYSALDSRLQLLLKENPDQMIFHTVQVERNGFIQAMVSGTRNEGRGYEYFGGRAYAGLISDESPAPPQPADESRLAAGRSGR